MSSHCRSSPSSVRVQRHRNDRAYVQCHNRNNDPPPLAMTSTRLNSTDPTQDSESRVPKNYKHAPWCSFLKCTVSLLTIAKLNLIEIDSRSRNSGLPTPTLAMSRLQSAFADELGVEHPILLAGMAVVASPRLAAAVSNAGGLGVIGAGFPNPSPRRLSKMLDELGRSELAGEPTPPRGITLL